MDAVLGKIQKKIDRKRKRRKQGEENTERLLSERKKEQEDSISNHVVIGGFLAIFLTSMVVFTLAKSAGIQLIYCVGFSIGTLVLGNLPFFIIWVIRNRDITIALLLFIPNVFLLCCSACSGLWYCIFWCRSPWENSGVWESYGNCKRMIDSVLCCLCQRGMCLVWTPSCCLCQQCHSSCFNEQQRRRREASRRRRRVSITQHEDGSVEMKEIISQYEGEYGPVNSKRVKEKTLDERDMEAIRKSLSADCSSLSLDNTLGKRKKKSSPRSSLRGISSSEISGISGISGTSRNYDRTQSLSSTKPERQRRRRVNGSLREKTDKWKTMFSGSPGNKEIEKGKDIEMQDLSQIVCYSDSDE